jgi:hypothetical protein
MLRACPEQALLQARTRPEIQIGRRLVEHEQPGCAG